VEWRYSSTHSITSAQEPHGSEKSQVVKIDKTELMNPIAVAVTLSITGVENMGGRHQLLTGLLSIT